MFIQGLALKCPSVEMFCLRKVLLRVNRAVVYYILPVFSEAGFCYVNLAEMKEINMFPWTWSQQRNRVLESAWGSG